MIKKSFDNALRLQDIRPGWFRLLEPLRFSMTTWRGVSILVEVPAGYETNLASVPRLLWPIFPPFGVYNRAAVIHDYLLDQGGHRFLADAIFRECMAILGVPWYRRVAMFYAVRMYSIWVTWRKRNGVRRTSRR